MTGPASVLAALVLAGMLVSGCGGSSRASASSTAAVSADVSSAPANGRAVRPPGPSARRAGTPQTALVKHPLATFSACMRAHGASPSKVRAAAGRAAVRACSPALAAALSGLRARARARTTLRGAGSAPHRNHLTPSLTLALQRFAACMRSDGVSLPPPGTTGAAIFNTRNLNKTSPQFKAAAGKCNPVLQKQLKAGAAR